MSDDRRRPHLTRRHLLGTTAVTALPLVGERAVGGEQPPTVQPFTVRQGDETYTARPLRDGRDVVAHYDPPRVHDREPDEHLHSSMNDLQKANTSRLYFWSGPEGLSLVVLHDTTYDGEGGDVRFEFEGLPDGEWVAKDDPTTHNDVWSETAVDWQWGGRNTDGGAYRGALREAEITLTPTFQNGIEEWQLLSATTKTASAPTTIQLDRSRPVTIVGPDAAGPVSPLQVYPYEILTASPLSVLSGFPYPPLEFRYENVGDETIEAIEVSASAPSDDLEITGTTAPEALGPGAVEDHPIDVDVAPSTSGQYPVDVTLSADGIDETNRRFAATVEETLSADVRPALAGTTTLEVGSVEPVAVPIEANGVLGVDDVEAVVSFEDVPGEWSPAESGRIGTTLRGDGGEWERRDSAWVWTKDRMARNEVRRPEIQFQVPDDIESGEYPVPVELSARDGRDGEAQTVAVAEPTLTVEQTLVSASLSAPESKLVQGEAVEIGVELLLLGDRVEEPKVRLEGFPGFLDLVGATASDGGRASTGSGEATWSWPGEHDPGQTYEATLTVRLPEDADPSGGTVSYAGRATARSVTTGETGRADLTGSVAISGLASFVASKRDLAATLDDSVPNDTFGEAETVDALLGDLTAAVGGGAGASGVNLTTGEAEAAVERLLLGERTARYCMDLVGPSTPPRPNLADGSLALRTAQNGLASAFGLLLCAVSMAKVAKAAKGIPYVGGRVSAWISGAASKFSDSIRQLITLGGRFDSIAQKHTDNIASEVASRSQVNARSMSGIANRELDKATLAARNAIIGARVTPRLESALGDLNATATVDRVESGLPGSMAAARDAYSGGVGFMTTQYRRADGMLSDMEEHFVTDFIDAGGSLADLTISLGQALVSALQFDLDDLGGSLLDATRSIVFGLKDVFDGVTSFVAPFHSTVLSGIAVEMITGTAVTGIAGVADGRAPEYGG